MTGPSRGQRGPDLRDRLFALLLQLLPHHLLSRGAYTLTRWSWPPFKNRLIRAFIRLFRVDMSEAECHQPEDFSSFNAFFTRALAPGARPLPDDPRALACPADGVLSQLGDLEDGRILQAKGRSFSARELLGGDSEAARRFQDGRFLTVYLSPRDYHRVHMPLSGTLRTMTHIPGRLFSVMPSTTRAIPRLFSRNERVVNLFETEVGPMALVLVGAIFVGSMDTVWAGPVTPGHRRVARRTYGEPEAPVSLERGQEMGRFNMGSTVILLFPAGTVEWSERLAPGVHLRMGEEMGRLKDR